METLTKKLIVKHDIQPENEVFINAVCWCDFCSRKLPEWKMNTNKGWDVQVCEDCYEHYN